MVKNLAKSGIVHKLVFELRYNYGYTYLDRCGTTINEILRNNPGWVHAEATPHSGSVADPERQITFSFGPQKLDLGQEQTEKAPEVMGVEEFATLADSMTQKVVDYLDLDEFTRIGFRVWRLFGQGSLDEARQTVKQMGLVSLEKLDGLGAGSIKEAACTVVFEGGLCLARVAVAPVEQNIKVDPASISEELKKIHKKPSEDRKKAIVEELRAKRHKAAHPQFAVLVDIDSYLEHPPYPNDLFIPQFVCDTFKWGEDLTGKIMALPKGGA